MFGNKRNKNELEPPPIADREPGATEVLRMWAKPGEAQQVSLRTTWKDPGAWGLALADIARHAARAYAAEGQDPERALQRIRQLWEAEFAEPTDEGREATGG